jgi:ribonuclease HI
MVYENALNIYTDGSSFSHPRRGGMAIRFVWIDEAGDEVIEDEEIAGHEQATNNEMELTACVEALERAARHRIIHSVARVVIFTDSLYVAENVPRAKFQWSKQKWLNRNGRPIENASIWKDLVRAIQKLHKPVDFEWVKGHAKDGHNKAVDRLAKKSAKGVLNRPLKLSTVRRKQSSQVVQSGSVPMLGQTLSIRVITDTYLRPQKVFKYKYEVLVGELARRVDLICSEHLLKAGHHNEIRVNSETKNPRIVEVLREIERQPAVQSRSPPP